MTRKIQKILSIQIVCGFINQTLLQCVQKIKFSNIIGQCRRLLGMTTASQSTIFGANKKSYRRLLTILLIMMIRSDCAHEVCLEIELGYSYSQSIELPVGKGEYWHIIRLNFDSSWSAEREHTSRLVEGK
jgi:hypothetical protein